MYLSWSIKQETKSKYNTYKSKLTILLSYIPKIVILFFSELIQIFWIGFIEQKHFLACAF